MIPRPSHREATEAWSEASSKASPTQSGPPLRRIKCGAKSDSWEPTVT